MNYSQLVSSKGTPGSIATWVNSSIIQNDTPEIVLEAESFIYRRLRHWKMLTTPTFYNMVIGIDSVPQPSDMLEPFLFWTTGIYFQIMQMKTPQEVVANFSYNGNGTRVQQQPLMYYMDQSNLHFDSPPDQTYQYGLIYFQQPAALAVSGSNFLTNTYPRLVRCCCMAAACEWMKDSGQGNFDRTYWDTMAEDEIEKAQIESDRAKRATVAGAVLIGGGIASNFPSYTYGY